MWNITNNWITLDFLNKVIDVQLALILSVFTSGSHYALTSRCKISIKNFWYIPPSPPRSSIFSVSQSRNYSKPLANTVRWKMPRLRLARSTIGRGYAIADGAYLRYIGQGQARFTLCHDSRCVAICERASVRVFFATKLLLPCTDAMDDASKKRVCRGREGRNMRALIIDNSPRWNWYVFEIDRSIESSSLSLMKIFFVIVSNQISV